MNAEMFLIHMMSQLEADKGVIEIDMKKLLMEGDDNHNYRVTVVALELDRDECDITTEHRGSLEEAMKLAIVNFCARPNNAGTVRSSDYKAFVVLASGRQMVVPMELWYPYHKMYGESRLSA